MIYKYMINSLKKIIQLFCELIHELPDFLYKHYYDETPNSDEENDSEGMDDNKSEETVTSYIEWCELCYNQDFRQHVNMAVSVSLELYRVMVSSLLVVFIPQKCGDHVCTLFENIHQNGDEYNMYLIMNYVTVTCFVLMYISEIKREEKLIKLLEVNNTISTDSESVGKRIKLLPEYKKKQIFYNNLQYQCISYLSIIIFIINTITSTKIICKYSLGNQTLINLTTNILFMISKLTNVLGIINTERNVYFSAYLNTKVQFNDLDPREIEKLEKAQENLMKSRSMRCNTMVNPQEEEEEKHEDDIKDKDFELISILLPNTEETKSQEKRCEPSYNLKPVIENIINTIENNVFDEKNI